MTALFLTKDKPDELLFSSTFTPGSPVVWEGE